MPWCDSCDAYRAPTALDADGNCPTCGREVDRGDLKHPPSTSAPWHFWVMVIALVIYLGWRVVEFIIWIVQQISG